MAPPFSESFAVSPRVFSKAHGKKVAVFLFIAQLNSKAVMARVYYPEALYRFKHLNYFDYKAKDFPVVEQMIKEVVSIPIHPGLTTKQIKYIIKTIRNI